MTKSRLRGVVVGALAGLTGVALTCAPAAAEPAKPLTANGTEPSGKHCVIERDDAQATVDALQHRCTSQQILDLFLAAPVGSAPTGTKKIALLPAFQVSGRLLPYGQARAFTSTQNEFGDSLTFTRRGDTAWAYKNYVWGRDAGGPLISDSSRIDHKPVHAADFSRDFAGAPISLHEYRRLTPGVWIGRDIGGSSKPSDTSETESKPTGGAFALS
ncbi:hypothetical protein AAFP35_10780 [Gordonia sp. CPCC 206044]|uniref:hypothetical protein n=1 Tax=Gordonia sp. CPCC 206044 TaxID=3140793 RepID=UPI003AF356F1